MKYKVACGAVVYTRIKNQIKYVIIKSLLGDYGFPKGHMEKDETEMETALREIYEETNLEPTIIKTFREVDEYPLPNKENVMKRSIFYLAHYEDQDIKHQLEELHSAELMSYEEAMEALSFDSSKKILEKAHLYIVNNKL